MTNWSGNIAASSDDAVQDSGGTVTLNGTTIVLSTGNYWAGFRWDNVTVPPGATVTAAYILVNLPSTTNDDANLNIYFQAADDPGTFTTAANDISSRSRTTAYVPWIASSIGAIQAQTPDLSAPLQEVFDRGGWASGNAVVAIMDALAGVALQMDAYDHATRPEAELHITYTTGGGVPVKAIYYARLMRGG